MFTKKKASGYRLSPTLDALVFHLCRASCQTFIWKSAFVPVLRLQSPVVNGWQIDNEKFCKELILNSSVPDAVVELTRCICKKAAKQIQVLANVKT